MDKKELLLMVEAVSNEKNILKNDVFQGLELGLALATDKRHGEGHQVNIDRDSGEWKTQDGYGNSVENITVGRISGQVVKNYLFQYVKNVSEKYKVEKMLANLGTVVNCKIHRINKSSYMCVFNGDEYIMPFRECISKEKLRVGDIVSVVVKCSEKNGKENIYLSRLDEALAVEMLGMEVPEIGEGTIEVVACSRVPGFKSKIVVRAKDKRLDAVGMCIGMKGVRVKAISEELGGEFLEILGWVDDEYELIGNVMDGDLNFEIVDEDFGYSIIVEDENLGMAIGRGGLNVSLIQSLINEKVRIIGKEEYQSKQEEIIRVKSDKLCEQLGVHSDLSNKLVVAGMDTIEIISTQDIKDLVDVLGIAEEETNNLQDMALDMMLVDAMGKSDKWESLYEIIDDQKVMAKFENSNLLEVNDIAELSVDELKDLIDLDDELCGKLIMSSRKVEKIIADN